MFGNWVIASFLENLTAVGQSLGFCVIATQFDETFSVQSNSDPNMFNCGVTVFKKCPASIQIDTTYLLRWYLRADIMLL